MATLTKPTPQRPHTVWTPAEVDHPTWLRTVAAVAATMRTRAPQLGARLDSAVQLVTTGAVSQDAQGRWQVESRTSPGVFWQADGSCDCPDAERQAPHGRCAHLLAVGLYRRALQQCHASAAHGAGPEASVEDNTSTPSLETCHRFDSCASAEATQLTQQSLPEAAFSLCLKGRLGGVEAQLTVRGASYPEFATNVAAVRGLLDTPTITAPVPQAATPPTPTPEGWCVMHGVEMTRQSNPRGTWWSHRTPEGGWCKGKPQR